MWFSNFYIINQDVTPENFLNVISGNSQAMKGIGSGRVVDRH